MKLSMKLTLIGGIIVISYRPLWVYLAQNNISKKECREKTGISANTWTKLNKGEEVSVSILNKICAAYNISYDNIMEYIPLKEQITGGTK